MDYDDSSMIVPSRHERNNDADFYKSIPEDIFERNNQIILQRKREHAAAKVIGFYRDQCDKFMERHPENEDQILSILRAKYSSCYDKLDNPDLNNYISCIIRSLEAKKVIDLPPNIVDKIVVVFM